MASTLHMLTTISLGQWQPWTAISPLLELISMAAVGSETLTAEASANQQS